jgi:trimethylamine--corrinoid protein Co-methyltransferase
MEFLDKQEIERIHSASMKVLEEVGVVVLSNRASEMLVSAGALRSKDGKRILIPGEMVKSSLASAPKSVLLAGRERKLDIRIPSPERLWTANGGEGIFMKNMLTGETRPANSDDLANFARLVDQLPAIDFFWPMVGALEQPVHMKANVELKICFQFTVKHIQTAADSTEEARQLIKLASILTGGPQELAMRPIFSATQCPISPLTFEKGLTDGQVELARGGIPVVAMSAAVAGLTSPITIAGTTAQVNAENLASLVITQVARKGAPFVYSSDSSPGDLQTGSIDYGALEVPLFRIAAGQMGRRYGLPTMVCGVGLEDVSADLGSAWEGVPLMTRQALVPSDLASGFGGVEQATGASYGQLVADTWIWELAREVARDFAFDDDAISFETIRDGGLDRNFLGKKHTISRFKKEGIAYRHPEAVLKNRAKVGARGSLIKKAHEEATRLLKQPTELKVTKDELRQMEDFLKSMSK